MRGFRAEPVAVVAVINAGLTLAVLFGVDITPEQQAGVIVFVNALLALFLRSQVTSERTLDRAGTSSKEVRGVARRQDEAHMAPVVDGRALKGWEREA